MKNIHLMGYKGSCAQNRECSRTPMKVSHRWCSNGHSSENDRCQLFTAMSIQVTYNSLHKGSPAQGNDLRKAIYMPSKVFKNRCLVRYA